MLPPVKGQSVRLPSVPGTPAPVGKTHCQFSTHFLFLEGFGSGMEKGALHG